MTQPSGFLAAMRRSRVFQTLRERSFRRLTSSQVFSNMSVWMDEVSRGWLLYELTDSVVQLGLIRGIQVVPMLLLSPLAGSLADRYSRRGQVVLAQAVLATAFAITALLVLTHLIQPWHLYVTALVVASATVFLNPARSALVSDLVPPQFLTNAIGINSVTFNMSRLLGPALAGGIIVLAGTGAAFSVQALFQLLATAGMLTVASKPVARAARRESFGRSIIEGWKFSWRSEEVRAALLCTMLASLLIAPFISMLPVFARDMLAVGASGQGLMLTAMGVGALISSASIANAGHLLPRGLMMLGGSIGYGVAVIAFASSPWFGLSLATMTFAGLCHVNTNGLVQTVVQTYSPAEMRGRAIAIFNMNQMMNVLGAMLLGLLAAVVGPRWAIAAMAVAGMVAIVALFISLPKARHIR